MSGRRHHWALYCPGDGAIYGPFPNEKEVKYYHLVVHMAGAASCSQGRAAKYHVAKEMTK